MSNVTMEFPTKYLNPLQKQGKLDESLDKLADIVIYRIKNSQLDSLDKFCQAYLRSAGQLENTGKKLRVAVASLIFDHGILRNSSVEAQWDIIKVYGPQNYDKVVTYLNSLPSFFHPKMKRFLMVCDPDKMSAAILFNSCFVDIISQDWLAQLKSQNPEIHLVAHHYNVNNDVRQLRSLFPQVGVNKANRLLRNSTLEGAIQALLDDKDAGTKKEQKTFEKLDRSAKNKITYVPDYERTLQLANALLDDDPDEENDGDIRVFSSKIAQDEDEAEPAIVLPSENSKTEVKEQQELGNDSNQTKPSKRGDRSKQPRSKTAQASSQSKSKPQNKTNSSGKPPKSGSRPPGGKGTKSKD